MEGAAVAARLRRTEAGHRRDPSGARTAGAYMPGGALEGRPNPAAARLTYHNLHKHVNAPPMELRPGGGYTLLAAVA